MNVIYIENRPTAKYPFREFGPSVKYPEYLYEESGFGEQNDVYEMIRNCLIGLGLDADNYNTKKWNPLGKYIIPGDHVLIKPNWVMHFNENTYVKENAMECLVTHPSCIRAICDYCLIALKGKGQILIADAPMQDCNLEDLLENFGYNDILRFYREKGEPVEFADLRKYQSIFNKNKVIIDKIYRNSEEINIDLSSSSLHEQREGKRIYQVDNYNQNETKEYHGNEKHVYSINKRVLDADVVINICKPKSHRLAGFTAAMKNMVGITYNKASLPHRVEGAIPEGGDAYLNKSFVKKIIDKVLERKICNEDSHHLALATMDRFIYGALVVAEYKFGRDPYIKGIWHGNDTIWRTVVDLNFIEQFADKEGRIKESCQRKILNFADMIIAGEHNGPCKPVPKPMGVIMAGENAAAMDMLICKMIGFQEDKIPMIRAIKNCEADFLFAGCNKDIEVISNKKNLCGRLEDIFFPEEWRFLPHDTWKDVIN